VEHEINLLKIIKLDGNMIAQNWEKVKDFLRGRGI
jgi:hypothetical protein